MCHRILKLADGIDFHLVRLYAKLLGALVYDVSVVGGSSAIPGKDLVEVSVDAVIKDV